MTPCTACTPPLCVPRLARGLAYQGRLAHGMLLRRARRNRRSSRALVKIDRSAHRRGLDPWRPPPAPSTAPPTGDMEMSYLRDTWSKAKNAALKQNKVVGSEQIF
jgi:hypothetical protein